MALDQIRFFFCYYVIAKGDSYKMEKMKEIVGFKSINGGYFEIWKADDGYHLKNKYTEVPNEFKLYDEKTIKTLFDDLCERVPECIPVDFASGHPNSCMRVVFADKSEAIYKKQEKVGKNLCAYISRVAEYSEFVGGILYPHSDTITIEHVRWVIKTKTESFSNVIEYLKNAIEDDYIDININKNSEDIREISKVVYGFKCRPFMTVFPNGEFETKEKVLYLEFLKENDVVLMI